MISELRADAQEIISCAYYPEERRLKGKLLGRPGEPETLDAVVIGKTTLFFDQCGATGDLTGFIVPEVSPAKDIQRMIDELRGVLGCVGACAVSGFIETGQKQFSIPITLFDDEKTSVFHYRALLHASIA